MTGTARWRSRLVAVLLLGLACLPADAGVAPLCTGDCDGNGVVSVDEVVRGVRLALGHVGDSCLAAFDRDANGRVDVAELLLAVGNELEDCPQSPDSLTFRFDFGLGDTGWRAGFADYPLGEENFYELEEGIRPLPDELESGATGFFLSGNNHSDDLFMFLKKRLGPEDGIAAGRAYDVSFDVRFASNAPSDCSGVGGAPGESVYFKAGASGLEPLVVPVEGFLVLNVDKGNQGDGGEDVSVGGNIANGIPCRPDAPYVSLRRSHVHPFPVMASDAGELWLLIGTDSGYEGTTALYYETVEVRLSPSEANPAPTASHTPTMDASDTPTPTPGCAISVAENDIRIPGCTSRPENLHGTLRVFTIPSDCCWNAFSNGLVTIEPVEGCGDTEVSYAVPESDYPGTRGSSVYFSAGTDESRISVGFTQSRGCTPTRSVTRTPSRTQTRTTTPPSPTITRTRTCTPGAIYPPTPGCSYEGPTFTRTASRTPTPLGTATAAP